MRARLCGLSPSWLRQKNSVSGLLADTFSRVARCPRARIRVVWTVTLRAVSAAVCPSGVRPPPTYVILRRGRRTKFPLPWAFSTRPSTWSTARALRSVGVLTLYCAARWDSEGRRSPGLSRPVAIWSRRSSAMASRREGMGWITASHSQEPQGDEPGPRVHGQQLSRVEHESFGSAGQLEDVGQDRKSTRLNSSHVKISYAVFCLKKKRIQYNFTT